MEEQNNHVQPAEPTPASSVNTPQQPPKKSKKTAKRTILVLVLALVAYFGYSIADIFISPDKNIQQIYLIPADAAFIIESSDPINDWAKFSGSDTWKCLKQAKAFAEVTQNINVLDSIVHDNKTLLSLIGKRDVLVSLHKVRALKWDFLMVIDLQKASKMQTLKDQMENVFSAGGFRVTNREHNGINIIEVRDPKTREIFYLAFIDNHFAVSYTSRLVEAAIDGRKQPKIGLENNFIEADKLVAGKGLLRMYINYANLPDFMSVFLGGRNEYIDMFSNSMDFAGLFFNTDKEKMEIKGYTFAKETITDPYMTALLNSGKSKMRAHEILSGRTALYTNIGFDNPADFVKQLEKALAEKDPASFESFKSTRKKLESYFGISLDEHFLSWMSGEFAMTQSEPGLLGQEPEVILAIRAKSIKDAHKKMDFIEKRIKNRTPVKIKTANYKDFEIKYVEMKGFFRLFFGSLFDKFEKPYYTYVDDYVVFSNKPSSLLSFIEDYTQENVLKNNDGFKKAFSYYNSSSTVFMFTDMRKFCPQLRTMLNASTWAEMESNKDVLYSFPYWSMQIIGSNQQSSLHYIMDYQPYIPEVIPVEAVDTDEAVEVDGEGEETVSKQDEMDELKRFYIEKFEGNVLRDFYPEGALKSETEIKDGKRHGRYREYYESGKLKVRGKYSKNQQKGTWKYYTEDGEVDHKEKF